MDTDRGPSLRHLSDDQLQRAGRFALAATSGGLLLIVVSAAIPSVPGPIAVIQKTLSVLSLALAIPGALILVGLRREWRVRHPGEESEAED